MTQLHELPNWLDNESLTRNMIISEATGRVSPNSALSKKIA